MSGQSDQTVDDPLDNYNPVPPPLEMVPPPGPVRRARRRDEDAEQDPREGLTPIEAGSERAILTALLTSPKVFDDLCDKLIAEDFGTPVHQAIYAAIVACDASGRPFDPITVADEMRRSGTLGSPERGVYLTELLANPVELENVDAYVEIVVDRALRRRMINAARVIGTAALNPQNDAHVALDIAEQQVFELGNRRTESSLAPMAQVIAKTQAEMARARTSTIVGRSTGIAELDAVTGGLRGGQLILIAARPAMGKSVLALQIATHIAATEDLPVPFFSYEMQHEELGVRMLAAATGIPMPDLGRGIIPTEGGMDRIFARELEKLSNLRLLIDERPPQTVSGLRSEIRRLARRGPLGAVCVDYIQLLEGESGGRSENRNQEVSFISRALKLLAVELDVPIIAVSQLSRQSEGRPNKRPMLNDLRDSGSLEQDANLVISLYRDWVYDRSQEETHAELILLKNRNGPLAEIAVDFEGACARFVNTTRTLDTSGGGFGPGPGAAGGAGPRGFGMPKPDLF